jgi:hypothetical protein
MIIPAKDLQIGDRLGGRVVRGVTTGRREATNKASVSERRRGPLLPPVVVVSYIVVARFDDGPDAFMLPRQSVEVERGEGA